MSDEVEPQYLSVGGRKRSNKVQTQKVSGFQSSAELGESHFELGGVRFRCHHSKFTSRCFHARVDFDYSEIIRESVIPVVCTRRGSKKYVS